MMDFLWARAEEILEIAKAGDAEHVSIVLEDNGPGVRPGLHLVMGEGARLAPQGAGAACFEVSRSRAQGGSRVDVRGSQGGRSCRLSAEVAARRGTAFPLLLNNQALYELSGGLFCGPEHGGGAVYTGSCEKSYESPLRSDAGPPAALAVVYGGLPGAPQPY